MGLLPGKACSAQLKDRDYPLQAPEPLVGSTSRSTSHMIICGGYNIASCYFDTAVELVPITERHRVYRILSLLRDFADVPTAKAARIILRIVYAGALEALSHPESQP